MKKMYCLPNTKMLLLALAITAVLGTSPRQANAQGAAPATTIKTVPTVEIMPSMWEYDTKHTNNDFFIRNGTAYLSYTQASVMFQDLVWSYNQKSGIYLVMRKAAGTGCGKITELCMRLSVLRCHITLGSQP